MRRVFALPILVLLPAALALAACGGGNDSQNAKTSSTTPTTASGATGATGTAKKKSGTTGKAKGNAKSNTKSPAKNKSKNKTNAGTRNGTGKKKSGSGTGKNRQKAAPTNTNTTPVKKAPAKNGKLPATDSGSFSVARTVCGGYLAETIKGKKLADLAKDYSQAWPSDRRQAAYDGCLAGLKQPRIPGSDEY